MRVFGIAGFKNAGKTTLVVDLVRELTGRGFIVGTIKHAHHEFDIDHPGKDSYLHRAAGAREVIVASSRRWAQIRELTEGGEPLLEELLARMGAVDVVLVEGYKSGTHPRLEVRREGNPAPPIAGASPDVRAIVTDEILTGSALPVLPRADVARIADFILAAVGLPGIKG